MDQILGRQLCADGLHRNVYRDTIGHYVTDGDGSRVYDVWTLTDQFLEDADPSIEVSLVRRS